MMNRLSAAYLRPHHFKIKMLTLPVIILLLGASAQALDNGLARTPPMGWLSWERFRCNIDCKNYPKDCISEVLYMEIADRMASDGYAKAGYQYVNIDDCWMSKQRDSQSRLVPDPERFPSGMKALADYVHSKGLKLGIYEDFGTKTCGGYPGSENYLDIDAQTFADWGIDSLKLDGCYSKIQDMPAGYANMSKALNKTGHAMLYSCSWPAYWVGSKITPNYTEIAHWCNLWRNYGDVQDSWDSVSSIIDFYGSDLGNFSRVAGPGNWNDPDMLIVGDFGLSFVQQRTQMGMWAMLAAPLYMSADLRSISQDSRSILLNRNVITVNQDKLGRQAKRMYETNHVSVWSRSLQFDAWAVLILNRRTDGTPVPFSDTFQHMGVSGHAQYKVYEVFSGVYLGTYSVTQKFAVNVDPSGGSQMLILTTV